MAMPVGALGAQLLSLVAIMDINSRQNNQIHGDGVCIKPVVESDGFD